MDARVFANYDFQSLANAFCWTALHSLWQGAVLAVAAGLVLLLTEKSKPVFRYNLFFLLLILFLIANSVTFLVQLNASNSWYSHLDPVRNSSDWAIISRSTDRVFFSPKPMEFVGRFWAAFLEQYAKGIIFIWLFVFLFRTGRTITGLFYLDKMSRLQAQVVEDYWRNLIGELAEKLHIKRRVLLMESALLDIPVLHGHFRRVIIVPIGFLTSLPEQDVEAILLHELAHIKRNDFLVNLIQCFFENIYFFNPGLWWVSSLIRTEREHCCDEIVTEIMSDRSTLVNALASFQELRMSKIRTNVSFVGNNNELLNRIKRIIFRDNKQLNIMEKFAVTTGLTATALALMVYFSHEKQVAVYQINTIVTMPEIAGAMVSPKPEILEKRAVRKITKKPLVKKDNVISADSISAIYKLIAELKTASERNELDRISDLKRDLNVLIWQEKTAIKNQKIELKLRTDIFANQKTQMGLSAALIAMQDEVVNIEAQKLEKRQENIVHAEAQLAEVSVRLRAQREMAAQVRDRSVQEQIITDLLNEGIIESTENLSFKLHNMFLIVNGVEQPESLHQKLKSKYLQYSWAEWVYNWDGASGHRFTGVRFNG